jgi:hypothetical protein
VSVDTYLKGKNTAPYSAIDLEGLKILVARSLMGWAKTVRLGVSQFLIWKSFEVEVEHQHGPT